MSLDPETVGIAHAQAETQRQPHPIGQRAQSWTSDPEWIAQIRASNARRAAETVDVVNGMDDAEVIKDVLRYIARHDCDVVRQALEENGVSL